MEQLESDLFQTQIEVIETQQSVLEIESSIIELDFNLQELTEEVWFYPLIVCKEVDLHVPINAASNFSNLQCLVQIHFHIYNK